MTEHATSALDEITLTLPSEREFQGIAHLVLGGIAVRRELTIETLEDLQLAVGALLDRVEPVGEVQVVVSLTPDGVEAKVGPVHLDGALEREPNGGAHGELTLARVLWAVVDDVSVEGQFVRLTKRVAQDG